jgi:hypothetical protein
VSSFPETVRAQLAQREVMFAVLVHFDFLDDPRYVHIGYGPFRTGTGENVIEWSGIGTAGTISGIEDARGGTAPVATFTLSGVDPKIITSVFNSTFAVKGRDVTVFVQFMDRETRQNLDEPLAIYSGVMDVMSVSMSGPSQRIVSLTAETLFSRRTKALWGNLSDRDQQRLYPGDLGLDHIATMPFKSVDWPIIQS